MEQLVIHTRRLTIRNLRITDLGDFYAYRSNPEVTRFQGFEVMTLEESIAFIREQANRPFGVPGEWVQYALEYRESGRLIGDCAIKLNHEDSRLGAIGITIAPEEQQNGFALEAIQGITSYLFKEAGLHRITETVDVDNTASVRLLERAGFKREGHFIENIFFKGRWGSEYQYAMLRANWQKSTNSQ